jgi:alpha-ribazole phosphatase
MNVIGKKERLRLYLIRHGEVEGAAEGMLLGRTDRPLSERGISQAHHLADELSGAQLTAVYSSDLQRATMTAESIAARHNLQVERHSNWREIDMGDWEGRSLAVLYQESPVMVAQVFDDPASFQYPSGESFSGFITRVQAALERLLQTHQSGDIALVAHGGVCRVIIGSALGIPVGNWLSMAQDYGCLNVIEWFEGRPLLVSLNYDSSGKHKKSRPS